MVSSWCDTWVKNGNEFPLKVFIWCKIDFPNGSHGVSELREGAPLRHCLWKWKLKHISLNRHYKCSWYLTGIFSPGSGQQHQTGDSLWQLSCFLTFNKESQMLSMKQNLAGGCKQEAKCWWLSVLWMMKSFIQDDFSESWTVLYLLRSEANMK